MRLGVGLLIACVVAGCGGDKKVTADSTLSRDLAMANQPTPDVPFGDTARSKAPTTVTNTPRRPPRRVNADTLPSVDVSPVAEPAPSQPPAVTPAPAPAPAPFKGLPAGATFAMTTKSAVCTTNLPGDKITATITEDVVGEHGAVIPAGTTVVLEVASVTPGDKPENATMTLRIRSVIVHDSVIAVPSDIAINTPLERHAQPRDKGADKKKVIGGAIAGAIVGQIMGKDTKSTITGAVVGAGAGAVAAAATGPKYDACLPAGGALRATTREPVPLNVTQ